MEHEHTARGVALVSGGGGLLGIHVVARLQKDGFVTVACSRKLPICLDVEPYTYACDLSSEKGVYDMLAEVERTLGPVVLGVHLAQSPIVRKKITLLDEATLREQFEVPVFGGFHFLGVLARSMEKRKRGVLIGVTSSVLGDDSPRGGYGGYISAKYALRGLLCELRGALVGTSVHVYEVAPGYMKGGMNADMPERLAELLLQKTGALALTTPDDVAQTISSLARETPETFLHAVDRLAKT